MKIKTNDCISYGVQMGLVFFVLLFLNGCSPYHYLPAETNMMGLSEEGEFNASLSLGVATEAAEQQSAPIFSPGPSPVEEVFVQRESIGAFSGSVGYSPKKHLGVFGSVIGGAGGHTSGIYSSVGVGTYHFFPFDKAAYLGKTGDEELSEPYKGLLVDFYAGYGLGRLNHVYTKGATGRLFFQEFYCQLGLRFQFKDGAFAYAAKPIRLDYQNVFVKGGLSSDEYRDLQELRNSPFNILQQSFRFELGNKIVYYAAFSWIADFDGSLFKEFNYLSGVVYFGTMVKIGDYKKNRK